MERLLILFDYNSQQRLKLNLGNVLICDSLELSRRVDIFSPDLVSKLDRRKKVTNTETKAHCAIDTLAILH
jgi:hypothetical protein